jgi:hypothetical protein
MIGVGGPSSTLSIDYAVSPSAFSVHKPALSILVLGFNLKIHQVELHEESIEAKF